MKRERRHEKRGEEERKGLKEDESREKKKVDEGG